MILNIDIPDSTDREEILRHYFKFCLEQMNTYSPEDIVKNHIIVKVGNWTHDIDETIGIGTLVVDWKINTYAAYTDDIHLPFYTTFNTLYKFSAWYKYFEKNKFIDDCRVIHTWFSYIAHGSNITIRNIHNETN